MDEYEKIILKRRFETIYQAIDLIHDLYEKIVDLNEKVDNLTTLIEKNNGKKDT